MDLKASLLFPWAKSWHYGASLRFTAAKTCRSSFNTNITSSFSFILADKVAPDFSVLFHSSPSFSHVSWPESWVAEPAAARFALNAQNLYKQYQPNFYLLSAASHRNWGMAASKILFLFHLPFQLFLWNMLEGFSWLSIVQPHIFHFWEI